VPLDPRRRLDGEPIGAAVDTAGSLLRRLAVPTPRTPLRTEAERWALDLPNDWERLRRQVPALVTWTWPWKSARNWALGPARCS
jgi:hypothetical protein